MESVRPGLYFPRLPADRPARPCSEGLCVGLTPLDGEVTGPHGQPAESQNVNLGISGFKVMLCPSATAVSAQVLVGVIHSKCFQTQ